MFIQCTNCDWKFYMKDKDHRCPVCGEYLSQFVEVGAQEDPEVDEYIKDDYKMEGDL